MDISKFMTENKKLLADYHKMKKALGDISELKEFPEEWRENFKKAAVGYLNQGFQSLVLEKIHKEMGFPVLK